MARQDVSRPRRCRPARNLPANTDQRIVSLRKVEVSQSGHLVMVPAVDIDGSTVIATGRILRIAAIRDESFVESGVPRDPTRLVAEVSRSGLGADLLTFPQEI